MGHEKKVKPNVFVALPPCCRDLQMGDEKKPKPMRLGDAVATGIIANETLAYFIGRTWLFFKRIGINPERMRFRQHLLHEVRGVWGEASNPSACA